MSISCNTSQKAKYFFLFFINLCFTHFCRNFKLFEFTRFFPPFDLVKYYPFLPFPPFETHFNPLSSTDLKLCPFSISSSSLLEFRPFFFRAFLLSSRCSRSLLAVSMIFTLSNDSYMKPLNIFKDFFVTLLSWITNI